MVFFLYYTPFKVRSQAKVIHSLPLDKYYLFCYTYFMKKQLPDFYPFGLYPVDKPSKILTAQERKDTPVFSGVLKYFPLAIMEVSRVSKAGNDQHHKGKPLHWDRSKSTDEADALARHLIQSGTLDTDGIRHTAKVCWRALALLEKELEQDEKKR
jgi:hypothetical protein